MRLKKIEITGFKSFYHKTTLIFPDDIKGESEITAIVGPNGSGKSNVADAIKWGLGGQGKKSFRGKKSLDVIFAGSPLKKPLSSAMVTLFFDNSQKKVPVEFAEIAISRKIYRSGENEYYLNNSRASLKEIISLLGEAGIGRESYSIVNQGMADRLLASSPMERRKILEEAARVKHLEIKKEDSLKNLEEASFNLAKSEALLLEIGPRLHNLEKTAQRKKEEQALRTSLLELARRYFGTWQKKYRSEKETLEERLKKEQAILKEKEQKAETLDRELEADSRREMTHEPQTEALDNRLETIRQTKNEQEKKQAISEGRAEIITEKIKLEESLLLKRVDLPFVEKRLEAILAKIILWEKNKQPTTEALSNIKEEINNLKTALQKGVIQTGNQEKINALKSLLAKEKEEREKQNKELLLLNQKEMAIKKEIAQAREKETEKKRQFYRLAEEAREANAEKEFIKDRIGSVNLDLSRLAMAEEALKEKSVRILASVVDFTDLTEAEELSAKELSGSEARLEMLARQLEVCGSIDETVVREYEETKERYQLLKRETKDIRETKKTLKKMIKELDQKITGRFNETMIKVNTKFQKYFEIIFGGGNAQLIFSAENSEETEENPNERENKKTVAGIEIKLSLPRKKIKNTDMLSGGEKTLTSLALLFAIIGSNPPPFVMLDEVDASLDESNSANFTKVVKTMARHSQFIVITHNREIMKEVRLLYGVTLRKDGTSQILSVDLEKRTAQK